jgi:hypothetical protein
MTGESVPASSSAVERVLVVASAVLALAASLFSWRVVGAQQPVHPLTVFYLIEAPALAWVGAWVLLAGQSTILPWAMTGALFGFCVVGGFSIGPSYLPADVLLGVAVLWRDRRAWRRVPARVGVAVLAAVIQGAMMLAIIRTIVG